MMAAGRRLKALPGFSKRPSTLRAERISRSTFAAIVAHRFPRELCVFIAFALMTIVMTWPWARHWRDTITDPGDPYTIGYTLWWDYHATFNQPTHLFDANIFYPYHDTLAFSEHDYGIALLFFPLFAAGVAPLTVHSLATMAAFAFSAYGAFRLLRTLTGSIATAWVAGIAFGFVPYRFHRMPHLHYIFAGWLPLVLEALVLFVRRYSWRRAAWLSAAFTMNALTCITWLMLSVIPLGLSAGLLIAWHGAWRDPKFWLRGALAFALSAVLLLPFTLPYWRVAKEHGFMRRADEVAQFSPTTRHWFAASARTKLWSALGRNIATDELALFPGLLAPLLSLGALLFFIGQKGEREDEEADTSPRRQAASGKNGDAKARTRSNARIETRGPSRKNRWLTGLLALVYGGAMLSVLVGLLAAIHGRYTVGLFGVRLFKASHYGRAFVIAALLFMLHWVLARTDLFRIIKARGLRAFARPGLHGQAVLLALAWVVPGFFGSFGMNFFFHRWLFDYVEPFRAIRVPARWAMIAFVGMAVLAAIGARQLAELYARRYRRCPRAAVVAVIAVVLVLDMWSAPLALVRGHAQPDGVTRRLKETTMRGGIVQLPVFGAGNQTFEHMIRAADHGKPLITATSSYITPVVARIHELSQQRPVPLELLDVLESVPTSYLILDYAQMRFEEIDAIQPLISYGLNSGRLRFCNRFDDRGTKDLFAIAKVEPEAVSAGAYTPMPVRLPPGVSSESLAGPRLPLEFAEGGTLLYRLYKVTFARPPTYAEFSRDLPLLTGSVGFEFKGWQQRLVDSGGRFAELLVTREEFKERYSSMNDGQYVEAVLMNGGENMSDRARREQLVAQLSAARVTRAGVLLRLASDDKIARRESNAALVTLHYFYFLERDPDPAGFAAWMRALATIDRDSLTPSFTGSIEYQRKRGGTAQ